MVLVARPREERLALPQANALFNSVTLSFFWFDGLRGAQRGGGVAWRSFTLRISRPAGC